MCGLAFVLAKGYHFKRTGLKADLFTQALFGSVLRGYDATGVYATTWDAKRYALHKKAMPSTDFINTKRYDRIATQMESLDIILGHTRAGTMGGNTDEEAHPFMHKHITLAHNGVLKFWKTLPHNADEVTGVDSDVLANCIAKVGYHEALKQVEGDFALTWHDAREKVVRITRNYGRPLFFFKAEDLDLIVGASEYELIAWVMQRNGLKIDKKWRLHVPPPEMKNGKNMGTVLTFDEKLFPKFKQEQVEFYTPPPAKPVKTMYEMSYDDERAWMGFGGGEDRSNKTALHAPTKPTESKKAQPSTMRLREAYTKLFDDGRIDSTKKYPFYPWYPEMMKAEQPLGRYKVYGFVDLKPEEKSPKYALSVMFNLDCGQADLLCKSPKALFVTPRSVTFSEADWNESPALVIENAGVSEMKNPLLDDAEGDQLFAMYDLAVNINEKLNRTFEMDGQSGLFLPKA